MLRRTAGLHKQSGVTGTAAHPPDPDTRRRRALYRASHRGTREMDFILGRFAEAELDGMGTEDLGTFEHLLEAPDTELFEWVAGRLPVPRPYDTDLFRRLRTFHGLGAPAG